MYERAEFSSAVGRMELLKPELPTAEAPSECMCSFTRSLRSNVVIRRDKSFAKFFLFFLKKKKNQFTNMTWVQATSAARHRGNSSYLLSFTLMRIQMKNIKPASVFSHRRLIFPSRSRQQSQDVEARGYLLAFGASLLSKRCTAHYN